MPKVDIRPLSDLPHALPILASAMSMSRAEMVIDQLNHLAGQTRFDDIVFVTCESVDRESGNGGAGQSDQAEDSDAPQAGVVVYHPAGTDFASLLLAGWSNPAARDQHHHPRAHTLIDSAARAIDDVLEPLLYQRGVRFLQYATDVYDLASETTDADANSLSLELASAWQRGFGLLHIGDLEYQSGSTDQVVQQLGNNEPVRVEMRPVTDLAGFAQVVERTYVETMDCPVMSKFRNAEETLRGYRQTNAFAPELWFSIHRRHDDANSAAEVVGCLVMGTHKRRQMPPRHSDNDDANQSSKTKSQKSAEPTVICELVYMGLVPEARGSGLGKEIVQQAAFISKRVGAERMILAVDESNLPARNLYHRAGMTPMMRESVWGKLIRSPQDA